MKESAAAGAFCVGDGGGGGGGGGDGEKHFMCGVCVQKHIAEQTEKGVALNRITCPMCPSLLPLSDLSHFLTATQLSNTLVATRREAEQAGMQQMNAIKQREIDPLRRRILELEARIEFDADERRRQLQQEAEVQQWLDRFANEVATNCCPTCHTPFIHDACLTIETCYRGVPEREARPRRIQPCPTWCAACLHTRPCPGGHGHDFMNAHQLANYQRPAKQQRLNALVRAVPTPALRNAFITRIAGEAAQLFLTIPQ